MRNVSGVTGAAPSGSKVTNYLHRGLPSSKPPALLRVARKSPAPPIEPGLPCRPGRLAFRYVPGSRALPGIDVAVPPERTPALLHTRITYPPEGTLIAMDPDIPYAKTRGLF